MTDDREFFDELRQIVLRRAASEHLVDTLAFVAEVAQRLESDPVFGDFIPIEYSGIGSYNRQLRVHGFTQFDDSDGTIGLVIGKWLDADEPETLMTADVSKLTGWLESFVREAVEQRLDQRIAEANGAYELASLLRNQREEINRIRLHIFSNQPLSQKFKEDVCGTVAEIPIERHIWDLQRLKAMYESDREREAVELPLSDFHSDGIPYLEAARTANLRSFLCVIEGRLLADIFEKLGSRVLEGNVRSFLGMKGGVNKGIRATIQDVPSLFFAYNNGIAATATKVTVEDVGGRSLVTSLLDFQIVNGGQTTASILSARKKDGLSLDGVTVQMKLTEINQDDAHDLVPKIAQFANTQNKVAIADFFANHPFHRQIENISRRLLVPARANVRVQSKWFYERARGQYQNERLYLSKSKKDAFDLEYPKEQVINKTELAKYDSTWNEKPHWVSLAAQKNFIKFAAKFSSADPDVTESEYWNRVSANYSDAYYKQIVAMALLWKRAEETVSSGRGDWYEGDYRQQIVTYSLSLMFNLLRRSKNEFDLDQVWANQSVDEVVEDCIRQLAIAVQRVLLKPPEGMTNVGEWCKKEACWNSVNQLSLPCVSLEQWTVTNDEYKRAKAAGRKQGSQDNGIAAQKAVLDLTMSGYWLALLQWAKFQKMVPPPDQILVQRASTQKGFLKINIRKDWEKLLSIKQMCEDEGFRKT